MVRSTLYEELKRGTVKRMRSNLTHYKKYFADMGQPVYRKHRKASHYPYKLAIAATFLRYLERMVL